MNNPFDELEPDPRAVAAARELMQRLPQLSEGKMFGVLVVDGFAPLVAFSGDAELTGFAPHVYDAVARARIEPEADAIVKRLGAELEQLPLDAHHAATASLNAEREALRTKHRERRAARHARGGDDEESRADKRERKSFEARAAGQLAAFAPLLRRRAALDRLRRIVSREAMRRIHETYVLRNARGETTTLRALFAGEPPWGAGECAAVKLLQQAIALELTPLALAEFWWGPPPPAGARVHGTFYPACRTKCGPVLPFLLRGLEVAPRRAFKSSPSTAQVLFEDEHVAVLSKPAGLLSAPGKEEDESALQQLKQRHPNARLAHRLDLDTSGVLLAALDEQTYVALQRQWSHVEKRYVAWLDGDVAADRGTITLPMRVDLDHRPRQLVDFEHGRDATTDYEVLERSGGRTRVALFPRTGRTHQLRVHAASGLGIPIVGDRLYGTDGARLMLHAEQLTFTHPATGARVTFSSPSPF